MTPEAFETLILATKNPQDLRQAFAGLSESQRKSLSTTAKKLFRQINHHSPNKDASQQLKKYIQNNQKKNWSGTASTNVSMALYALCPLSVLKRSDIYLVGPEKTITADRDFEILFGYQNDGIN